MLVVEGLAVEWVVGEVVVVAVEEMEVAVEEALEWEGVEEALVVQVEVARQQLCYSGNRICKAA